MSHRSARLLFAIALLGLAARLGYLFHATSQPRYVWDDPDHYRVKAERLARGDDGWRWSFDFVEHAGAGRVYALPPGYPVFLSMFASLPGFPRNAQVGQAVLSAATIVFLGLLGLQLHSARAGLIAAAIYAAWLPNIIAVWSTMQESLFVPLIAGSFVLLFHGVKDRVRPPVLAVAGLGFGLATLVRSMPLYAMPLFAAITLTRAKKTAFPGIAALCAGFLLATVPYSVALSQHLGQTTFVENHGSFLIVDRYGCGPGAEPATMGETASILVRAFVEAPLSRLTELWTATRSILHVNGGRLLQIYLGAATELGAAASRLATTLLADGSFVLSVLLAPLGFAVSRRRHLALYAVCWVVVCLGLTALSGFGGARLRAPFEPHLIVLASVVAAGGWRKISRIELAPVAIVTAAVAALVLPQVTPSMRARGDYGVHWPLRSPPKRSRLEGSAGFNLLPYEGSLRFHVRSRSSSQIVVEVRINGVVAERVRIDEREHRFDLPTESAAFVYVEIAASDANTDEPIALLVIVPSHRSHNREGSI